MKNIFIFAGTALIAVTLASCALTVPLDGQIAGYSDGEEELKSQRLSKREARYF